LSLPKRVVQVTLVILLELKIFVVSRSCPALLVEGRN